MVANNIPFKLKGVDEDCINLGKYYSRVVCQKGNRFTIQEKPHKIFFLEIHFMESSRQHVHTSINKSLTTQGIINQQIFKLVSKSIK